VADDAYVLLCTCRHIAEVQMARAALEARGVPVRIEGAAVQGVLGMIHGAALAPRVMVPKAWRKTAREIVADIVGPFDAEDEDDDAEGMREDLPFRTAAADDEVGEEPDDVVAPEDDEAPAPVRRSFAIPVMLGMLAMPWGFGHIYARKPMIGVALMVIAVAAAIAFFSGIYEAGSVLIAVAITDVIGSMFFVARYNRALPRVT
jgi:hypothetical protein